VPARITLVDKAPRYHPPLHDGVDAVRLQGHEAGPTQRFWVGRSLYQPGGAAQLSPAGQETVYVVLAGELTLAVPNEGIEQVLHPGDSVHLPQGTERSVTNASDRPAELLVVIATPQED
jgi:quercetin dioxygenase-like cupin family protein